jgi:ubiquinone/menaquinone biosynthesis C-methylase UbiE
MGIREQRRMMDIYGTHRERPSTYVLPDGITPRELQRLHTQDELYNISMGEILEEEIAQADFHHVLDAGCGSGGWLIEAARAYPTFTKLIGVDISEAMIEHAREQAGKYGVHDRVEFYSMDALQMLRFSDGYFDLVNQRFGFSYLRLWDWRQVLTEYRRVTRSGGVIRLTETDVQIETNSKAGERYFQLIRNALYASSHLFPPQTPRLTSELPRFLQQAGLKQIKSRASRLEYRPQTPTGRLYYEDIKMSTETLAPFIRKWSRLPADYDALCQQMLADMQQPDFVARVHLTTAWGVK